MNEIFEIDRLLFNDLPLEFIWEVIFRSTVMFLILLLTLKLAGKRGVKQLSIFETVIIIALGSAAGDPMFYEDVGIVPAAIVFMVIISLYRLVTWLTAKSKNFEEFIEGKTECLIKEGQFSISTFKKGSLAQDEFFSELRVKSIEHLGQIKNAYIEPSGEISVFYYEDKEVKYGLPILPHLYSQKSETITKPGIYACAFCGNIEELTISGTNCKKCDKKEWVFAIKTIRQV
ncbi:MAG TPA: YetF domain-containing protein [Flavobacterium sp.]|nr:YetF domain-containing protein [Flavobacterium sp.]